MPAVAARPVYTCRIQAMGQAAADRCVTSYTWIAAPACDAEVHTVAGHPVDLGEVFPDRLHHACEQGTNLAHEQGILHLEYAPWESTAHGKYAQAGIYGA